MAFQLEDRRIALEKYLQQACQDPRVVHGSTFNGFLLGAQQETRQENMDEVDLEVFLMNDHKIIVRGLTVLQTDEVLERVCRQLDVPEEFVYYFGLYLLERKPSGHMTITRKLQHFESPYISQKSNGISKIVLRKA